MTLSYEDFIKNKKIKTYKQGIHVDDINDKLFDWQKSVVKWALEKGTACLFEDCGLGKTAQQLEWADKIHKHTQRPVLIVAPLTVSYQTEKEGLKFGVKVNICRKASDVVNGVNITNKEEIEEVMDGMNLLLEVFANAWAGIKKDEPVFEQMKIIREVAKNVAIESIQVAAMCDKFDMSLQDGSGGNDEGK